MAADGERALRRQRRAVSLLKSLTPHLARQLRVYVGMTMPRRVMPGMTVMITRRTVRRTHLFRPDPELNNLYLYCLAVLSKRFDIRVHAAVLMSTHEHLIVTDVRGLLPCFIRELHRLFALGVKALRRWDGAVWDHEKTSVVELRTPAAVLEKIAYVIANPVAAGVVRCSHHWSGVAIRAERLGRDVRTATRPAFYFDAQSELWPLATSLEWTMPDIEIPDEDVREAVAMEVQRLEREARENARATRRKCLDAKGIARLSPYDRARSSEPLRDRNPTFAVGRGQREAFFYAVATLREFRRAYHCALKDWRASAREVVFPCGTWLMRTLHQVAVATS